MGAFNRLLMAAAASRGGSLIRRGLSSTAVCRSSAPWLMLPSNEVADTFTCDAEVRSMDYSFYRLSNKDTISLHNKTNGTNPIPHDAFCVGSSKGWLLYSDPADCTLFLTNPLVSPSPPTIPLPPVTTLPYINATIGCSPKNKAEPDSRFSLTQEFMWCPPEMTYARIIGKFSISSGFPDSQDCVIMVNQFGTKALSFCKPALNMEAWISLDPLDRPPSYLYDGIVYSSKEQLFYTLTKDGGIVTWDLCEHLEPKREAYKPVFNYIQGEEKYIKNGVWIVGKGLITKKCLVESSGDILLVCSHYSFSINCDFPEKIQKFHVYKLNDAKDSWEQINSLGDRVLFLGMNEPFSLSASDFPELKPNSIYFTAPDWEVGIHSATDWGIYDLDHHTVTCHYPCSYWSKLRPPPIWIQMHKS